MNRFQEIVNANKISEMLHKKEQEDKHKKTCLVILAVIGIVAAIAGIAYAVYYFFCPDYLEDFEDDEFYEDLYDDVDAKIE